jgi:hypothetical protein
MRKVIMEIVELREKMLPRYAEQVQATLSCRTSLAL